MTSATHPYHHGDLPNALRRAAAEVIAERGVAGFSLREVSRRAGVSHTAPAHHFGDVRGLLTSLAEEGFEELAVALEDAESRSPHPPDRLVLLCEAYVEVARSHPAHFQVMFRTDVIELDDPDITIESLRAYGILERTVQGLIDSEHLAVDLDTATWMCWSAIQGLVLLEPKIAKINALKNGAPLSTADLVRRYVELMLDGLRGT